MSPPVEKTHSLLAEDAGIARTMRAIFARRGKTSWFCFQKSRTSTFRPGLPDTLTHSSVKELFTPGQEAAGARPSRAQVRNSSSETHLLKTVASGGAWHSQEDGEEALVTGPNFRPNRQESVLGMRSCHSEEDCEEASATSL